MLKQVDLLLKKLNQLTTSKTLFVFGAGASAFYIPIKYDLYQYAIKELLNIVMYPPNFNINLEDSRLIQFYKCGSPFVRDYSGKLILDEKLMGLEDKLLHSNPSLLDLISATTYSLENEDEITFCPEYEYFNRCTSNSLFLTLNHDRLATRFINKKVLPLHGEITSKQRAKIKKIFPYVPYIDISELLNKDLYMVKKEEEFILLSHPSYIHLTQELSKKPTFTNICIIGYSFFKKNQYDIYDIVTYDLLRDYILDNKVPVTIIDLDPSYVADILAKSLDQLNIVLSKIDWSCFMHALFWVEKTSPTLNNGIYNTLNLRRLSSLYDFFLNERMKNFDVKILNRKSIRF
ncbi:hypothetical protein [Legionella longbeachae]|uniref:hypothetical protein n=1 Tax=Legionella longbeachae TaxID=450 RepID=UPI001C16F624|nr:hypothetical protein [Legionella pneumophila]